MLNNKYAIALLFNCYKKDSAQKGKMKTNFIYNYINMLHYGDGQTYQIVSQYIKIILYFFPLKTILFSDFTR